MDDIDKAFKDIDVLVFEKAQIAPYRESVRLFRRVRRAVDGSTKNFYNTLSSRFMDVNAAPQELGVTWDRLSLRWRNYKSYVMAGLNRTRSGKKKNEKRELRKQLNANSYSGSDRFYFGISPLLKKSRRRPHLKDMIAALDVEATLGLPEVRISQVDNNQVYLTQTRPNEVPRVRDVGTARFADTKTLTMEVNIEAYLTPKLIDRRVKTMIRALSRGGGQVSKIIARLEKSRPLFIPYLKWYTEMELQRISRRIFR